jgi:fumarate hydratase class II
MLVTAIEPRTGYDKTVMAGKLGLAENITVKQVAEEPGDVRPERFDRRVVPAAMTVSGTALPGGGD